jgi:RNA polymerase sigma-70 factor (ECF subfamily)
MSETEFKNIILPDSRRLYSVAYRILRSKEDAEDAVQEVLLRLWKMRLRLAEYSSVEALSTTMIRNYCLDRLRKKRSDSTDDPATSCRELKNEETPYEVLKTTETRDIIKNILTKMPDLYSSLVQKHDIDGLSYEEISVQTSQNVNTLRVTLSRARKMLRDEYNKLQYEAGTTKRVAGEVL